MPSTADDKKVIWQTRVQLTILDKWDTRLAPGYDGAKVQERVKNPGENNFSGLIGLDISAPNPWSAMNAGTAVDVVVGHLDFDTEAVAEAVAAGTTVYPKDFAGVGVPNPVVSGGFELKFYVDGEELKGILKRTRTIKDNKETVKNDVAE